MTTPTKSKSTNKRRLARLTVEEDAAWDVAFEYYGNNSDEELTDEEIAELAWKDIQEQFPRLKDYDGALPQPTEQRPHHTLLKPRLDCALALPCSADLRYHLAASALSFGTLLPCAQIHPRLF